MQLTDIIKSVQSKIGVTADGIAGPHTLAGVYSKITGKSEAPADAPSTIIGIQQALGISVDGVAGLHTWTAIDGAIAGSAPAPVLPPVSADGRVDDRSEGIISTLTPEVQPYARSLVHKAADAGITIKLLSGLRTYAEQDALYAQGRTAPGHIVTNAAAGHSNHNFGLAFDIGVFDGGKYLDESPLYKKVGAIGKSIGLFWGGDWISPVDEPHFELRPSWASALSEGDMLTALRQRKDSGQSYFA